MGAGAAVPGVRLRRRRRSTSPTSRRWSGPTPPRWQDVLARPDAAAAAAARRRGRRSSTAATCATCSALFDRRLGLMLDEDDPLFANWDQDETAVAERYGEQDPAVVAAELAAAGDAVAAVVRRRRRRPVGASRAAQRRRRVHGRSFARYFVHDPVHHLWDVGGLSGVAGPRQGRAPARAPGPSRVSWHRWCRPHHRCAPSSVRSCAGARPLASGKPRASAQSRSVTAMRDQVHDADPAGRRRPTSGRSRRSAARAS